MSNLYYDKLAVLKRVEIIINKSVETIEEREELWQIVDETLHHRVLNSVLCILPEEHHHDFLCMFHECPYDEKIINFINQRIDDDIEKIIKKQVKLLEKEILGIINKNKELKK